MSHSVPPSHGRPLLEPLEPRLLLDGGPLLGDMNGDGKVDGGDLALWQQNYDPTGASGPYSPFDGDLNTDSLINGGDLALWQQTYNPLGATGDLTASDVPPTPGMPDLLPAYDSGISDTDDLTNVTTATVEIEAGRAGDTIRIYNDGTYLGDATLVTGTTYRYTFAADELSKGDNPITARAWDGGDESEDGIALTITLDTSAFVEPYLIGTMAVGAKPWAVDVVGSLAYVVTTSELFKVVDISEPLSPRVIGSCSLSWSGNDVEVIGSYAYVSTPAVNGGFEVVDVSNPMWPVRVGFCDRASNSQGLAIAGSVAYAPYFYGGLHILDISTPTAPSKLSFLATAGQAYDVDVTGSVACVATYSGLELIDVSDPSSPSYLSTYDSNHNFQAVDVVGTLAYVAYYDLYIVDISDPLNPVTVGSAYAHWAHDIQVVGSRAYVVSGAGLFVYDVSDPSAPVKIGSYGGLNAYAVEVAEGFIYVTGNPTRILSDTTPVIDLETTSDTGPHDDDNVTDDTTPTFSVAGGWAYTQIYRDGVLVSRDYETGPVTLTVQPTGTYEYRALGVDAAGNTSEWSPPLTVSIGIPLPPTAGMPDLLAASDSGVSDSDDITNVTTAVIEIDASGTGLTAMKIYVKDVYVGDATHVSGTTYQYAFTAGQLKEGDNFIKARTFNGEVAGDTSPVLTLHLDTTAPVAVPPYTVSTYELVRIARDIKVVGSLAYVANDYSGLQIFDVSDPYGPSLVGSVLCGRAVGIDVSGSIACVTSFNEDIYVINVLDPSAPSVLGRYTASGEVWNVQIVGSLAFAASFYGGLTILDISTPTSPTLVGSYAPIGGLRDLHVVGSLAYLAAGYNGLQILDISNPSSPTVVGSMATPSYAWDIQVVGTTAYMADLDGLLVIDVSTPSAPSLVGFLATPEEGRGLDVVGTQAFLANGEGGLLIIDVSTPSAPVLTASIKTPWWANHVDVAGGLAYVADSYGAMQIIGVEPPSIDLAAASDTGVSDTDNVTSDTTPTFNTVTEGPYVRIYRDAVQVSGDYESNPGTLGVQPYGTFDYTARAVDVAGNTSDPSDALTVTFASFVPAPGQPDLVAGDDSGVSDNDDITNMTTPTIRIEADNETLTLGIFVDGTHAGNATQVSGTTFQYTFTSGQLSEGANEVVAAHQDAGVWGDPSTACMVTLDTIAPAKPTIDLADASDTGTSNTDNVTDDTTPTFDVSTGQYARIYRDGGLVSGSWDTIPVTLPLQPEGTFNFTAVALDAAGNASPASDPLSVRIGFVPAQFDGQVWHDLDRDGTRDGGENGINGLTVELVDGDSVVATALTESIDLNSDTVIDPYTESGLYTFTDVDEGAHTVRVAGPAGWTATVPTGISDDAATLAARNGATSVVAEDIDGDSDLDLIVAGVLADQFSVRFNNGDGTFAAQTTYTTGSDPRFLTAGDVDNDDDIDVVVTNQGSDNVQVFLNNGGGVFHSFGTYAVGDLPLGVTLAKLNADDYADIVVTNPFDADVSVLINNGDGTFAARVDYAAGYYAYVVEAADLDGDDDFDLAVANNSNDNVSVLLNNGDGTFAAAVNYAAGNGPRAITFADFDGDHDLDIATANYLADTVSILISNGDGTFAAAVSYAVADGPWYTAALHLDGDGAIDLVVACGNADVVNLLVNQGSGTFASIGTVGVGDNPRGIAAADLDDDGDTDIVTANYGSDNVTILWNSLGVHEVTVAEGAHLEDLDFGGFIACDANGDMKVDGSDLAIWQQNYDPAGVNENTPEMGDFNGDGKIDEADVAVWEENYNPLGIIPAGGGFSTGASAPSAVDVLALLDIDLLEMSELLPLGG